MSRVPPSARGSRTSRRAAGTRVHWRFTARGASTSAAVDGEALEALVAAGRARVVKHGAQRRVYRLDLPEGAYYLKRLTAGGWLGRLQQWFRPDGCRREFEQAEALAARGVPALRVLGFGQRRAGPWIAESYLLSEAVPDAATLTDYLDRDLPRLEPAARRIARARLLVAVARLLAAAHEAGAWHDDLHGGNLLVARGSIESQRGPAAPPRVVLVDVPGVQWMGPLDWARSRASLAMLGAAWRDALAPEDRRRFWGAYRRARPSLPPLDPLRVDRELRAAMDAHARAILAGRDKRALATNRDFCRVAEAGWRGHALSGLGPETRAMWLAEAATRSELEFNASAAAGSVAAGETVVCRTPDVGAGLLSRIVAWLRPGHVARRAWLRGQALVARGLPVARPLLMAARASAWPAGASASRVWQAVSRGSVPLDAYLVQLTALPAAARHRAVSRLAAALGTLAGQLDRWGVRYPLAQGRGLAVSPAADAVRLVMVEPEWAILPQRRAGGEAARAGAALADLRQLASVARRRGLGTRSDLARLARAYAAARRDPADAESPRAWRGAARAILRRG